MEQYLDVRKIPRLEFEMHLEQLVKCIREITD